VEARRDSGIVVTGSVGLIRAEAVRFVARWISDVRRFQGDYPQWRYGYNIEPILAAIIDGFAWQQKVAEG
jgi:hypothetical protein